MRIVLLRLHVTGPFLQHVVGPAAREEAKKLLC
jgi:hypothetical protein